MKVHVAVSRESEVEKVATDLSRTIKEALGSEKIDLVFVFFSIQNLNSRYDHTLWLCNRD